MQKNNQLKPLPFKGMNPAQTSYRIQNVNGNRKNSQNKINSKI